MGGSFARNLIADGWIVAGVDPDPKRRKEMTKAGVAVSDSVKELIAEVPVVITSLPKPMPWRRRSPAPRRNRAS
jgi:putative dehydrogenase